MIMRVRAVAVAMSVAAALALAACGGGSNDAGGAGSLADADQAQPMPAAVALDAAGQPAVERKVVYTGELVVRVESADNAVDRAVAATERAGGFVFAQEVDQEDDDAVLTLKVPADEFDVLVEVVSDLGAVLRRSTQAKDVTADVVDLDGRLKTAQASADRLRTLLAEAGSASDIVAVEAELAKRESEIESLQGRLRVLTDQVELATITARFTERDDLEVSDDLPGFLGGLRLGITSLANVGLVLLVVVGFLVPFVPFVAGAVWLWRWYRRRRPRRPRQPRYPTGWTAPQSATPPAE